MGLESVLAFSEALRLEEVPAVLTQLVGELWPELVLVPSEGRRLGGDFGSGTLFGDGGTFGVDFFGDPPVALSELGDIFDFSWLMLRFQLCL